MTSVLAPPGIAYLATELSIGDDLKLERWLELCRSLGAIAKGHQFWIGDCLVYGEEQYGEEFAQGEAELGIGPKTAANYRWVASRLDRATRREDLTWSHHAEVARLKPKDQERMLQLAADEDWSVLKLREHVAVTFPVDEQQQLPGVPGPEPASLTDAEQAAIARRLETLQESFEKMRRDRLGREHLGAYFDEDDVAWMLTTLRYLSRGGKR